MIRSEAFRSTVFDSSDGVWSRGRHGRHSRYVTKSPDGKIWFSPPDGVSVIDPRHLPFNKLPPPVHVEQITADGKTYDASKGLRLPPRVRDLSIDYTALSLVAPEKVRFRFKLEGQDSDWREVVNDRHVQYSNLAPGNYRFRVIACNNSGVWNEEGASLDFADCAGLLPDELVPRAVRGRFPRTALGGSIDCGFGNCGARKRSFGM